MDVIKRENLWAIEHAGKIVRKRFVSEDEAWQWADRNIDDQMFDEPNHLSPPLEYEDTHHDD